MFKGKGLKSSSLTDVWTSSAKEESDVNISWPQVIACLFRFTGLIFQIQYKEGDRDVELIEDVKGYVREQEGDKPLSAYFPPPPLSEDEDPLPPTEFPLIENSRYTRYFQTTFADCGKLSNCFRFDI